MMTFRLFACSLLMLLSAPALAQSNSVDAANIATPAPKPATVRVSMQTAEGPVLIELETERAPITARNFLRYVDLKRFDGSTFYRAVAVPGAPQFGLVQGGVRFNPKLMLPAIAHEPTTKTGLSHADGTISMARNAPGTAAGDFFITLGEMSYMNADPKQPGDNVGYAAFGHVVEGMDVLRKILAVPTSPTEGTGSMRGQMIAAPIKIISVRRVK